MRVWDTSQQAKMGGDRRGILRERLSVPYACYETVDTDFKGKDGKGIERKRIFKNGHIVVKNPLAYELPKREVLIKSSRTLYRFTGSYDGQRTLPSKILRLMEQDNLQTDDDNGNKER